MSRDAGIMLLGPVLESDLREWERMVAESLRQELIPHRVRVSVVEPGTVDTELMSHVRDDVRQAAQRQVESIEPLRPEDVADAILGIVIRDRCVAVNEVLIRAAEQSW